MTFIEGGSLRPVPPGAGKDKAGGWIDIYEDGFQENQLAERIRQAAALLGWPGL